MDNNQENQPEVYTGPILNGKQTYWVNEKVIHKYEDVLRPCLASEYPEYQVVRKQWLIFKKYIKSISMPGFMYYD